jgi:glycerol-3-phosphate dehydrogenase
VNATGSWAAEFLQNRADVEPQGAMRLVKGSHIVTRRLYPGDHAYILQNSDKRVVFVIPYEDDFSLIGTTDVDWRGEPTHAAIDAEEVDYLCRAVNRWLRQQITPGDVLWSFAGIRSLYDDHSPSASQISRDYVLSLDEANGRPPILSVYGGKITTHRALAEDAVDRLVHHFDGAGPAWTRGAPLPGGDLDDRGLAGLIEDLADAAPFLESRTVRRLAQSYGSRAHRILHGARRPQDLGDNFGAGLTSAEVDYLVAHEWAQTAEDILWRRSKLGLHMSPRERACFSAASDAAPEGARVG